jgi:hypothetical protein
VRQVLRYRFLYPNASPEVITQKLCHTHLRISLRSVHRIIAGYGVKENSPYSTPKTPLRPCTLSAPENESGWNRPTPAAWNERCASS